MQRMMMVLLLAAKGRGGVQMISLYGMLKDLRKNVVNV